MLIVVVVARQTRQMFLAEGQIVEFILEDDAGMEEAVLDDIVAGGLLLIAEGNLCQIVFPSVGILGRRQTVFVGLLVVRFS